MQRRWNDQGITTVEWLGMAAIAVIVVAVLLPGVRWTAQNVWNTVTAQLTGLF